MRATSHYVPTTPYRRWFLLIGVVFCAAALVYAFLQVVNADAAAPAQVEPPIIQEADVEQTSDLRIITNVNKEAERPGQVVTYTIRYTNTLDTAVSNVVITSTLSYLHIYSGTYQSMPEIPPSYFSYTNWTNQPKVLRWEIPYLPPRFVGEIYIPAMIPIHLQPVSGQASIMLGNVGAIASTQTPAVTGNFDDAVLLAAGPLLVLDKVATPTAGVMPGHLLTYTLTVLNKNIENTIYRADCIPATNWVVTDTLPTYTQFYAATEGGVFREDLGQVVWRFTEPLPCGASRTMSFQVLLSELNDRNIRNYKENYRTQSVEMYGPVNGKTDVSTTVLATLRKTAMDKDGGTVSVFPRDEVTYTITVNNPISIPLTGVVVTDTLPGDPLPFTYLRPAFGSPAPQVLNNGRNLRWQIDLPAWGSRSLSFVVSIPNQTYIGNNNTFKNYENDLSAAHPETYFFPGNNLAQVQVKAAVIMDKTVQPDEAINGEIVTYTITLENRVTFPVSGIHLTDTMDVLFEGDDFHYVGMSPGGPQPLPDKAYNPVEWNNLALAPGQTYELSFRAQVQGRWLRRYNNDIEATSPDAYIPTRTNRAAVYIEAPIGINKWIDEDEAFLNSVLRYDLQIYNRSDVDWVFDYYEDVLPPGFYEMGTNQATVTRPQGTPVTVPPKGYWEDEEGIEFQIRNVNCSILPENYPNAAGAIDFNFIEPEETRVTNAGSLATVTVLPNIEVDLIPSPYAVQRGSVFTYTLHMWNQSPFAANDSTITIVLPSGFTYLSAAPNSAPTTVSPDKRTLTWTHVTIADFRSIDKIFYVQVGSEVEYRTYRPTFSGSAYGVCFGQLGSGEHPLGDGDVNVREWVVELIKKTLTLRVPPAALVDFEIQVKNNDAYPIVVNSITDQLPPGFTYDSMVSGELPSLVENGGNRVTWLNKIVPTGDPKWVLRARAPGTSYGTFVNQVYGTYIGAPAKSSGSTVTVDAVLDLKKDVSRPTINPGGFLVYTITLINQSNVVYNSVTVTDTLPSGFKYFRSINSDYPISFGPNGNRPVWIIPQIDKCCGSNSIKKLVYQVVVMPFLPFGAYQNEVWATSVSGSIPSPVFVPVTVQGPVYLNFLPRTER